MAQGGAVGNWGEIRMLLTRWGVTCHYGDMSAILGTLTRTARGFERIDFKDLNGDDCSLQESSVADRACIWLGAEKNCFHPGTKEAMAPRMHLDRERVLALVAHLQNWLNRDTFKIQ